MVDIYENFHIDFHFIYLFIFNVGSYIYIYIAGRSNYDSDTHS